MKNIIMLLGVAAFISQGSAAFAENHDHHDHHDKGDKTINVVQVAESIYMLQAGGGNIGVQIGENDLFVIDSDYKAAEENVVAAIKELSNKPIKLLVNTHWHFDHVGGNEALYKEGAVIAAHENVRKRMKAGQYIEPFDKTVEPASFEALPLLTYTGDTHVHVSEDGAKLIPVGPAHTDGDSMVHWKDLNVIHTGDVFFNGFWPFIDTGSAGGIDGMIDASAKVLELADESTKIIPGHGPLANKADVQAYRDALVKVATRAHKAQADGKTLEEWIAEKPLADLDEEWGDGFLPTDKFIGIVWAGLK